MGYNKECYRTVRAAFEEKRNQAQMRAEVLAARLARENPDLAAIDRALADTAMSVMEEIKKGSAGISERIAAVRAKNEELQRSRAALLVGMGYAADATDPKYECALCEDSGQDANGRMCACFKRALAFEGMRASGLGTLVDSQSFESFRLDYYQGEDRKNAEYNLRACKSYAENFGEKSPNLTFIGATGLGKTHMSTAIARAVIEKGYDVVYETAQNIMNDFEAEKFSYGKEEKRTGRYMDCDLLIIDDLGTEAQSQYTVAFLYNIINTRINTGKKTIINTNLARAELHKRYGDRITSRLFGEYVPLIFTGKDIRFQKLQ